MPGNLKTIALFFLIAILFFLNAMPMNPGKKGGFCMHNEDGSTGADWVQKAPKACGLVASGAWKRAC